MATKIIGIPRLKTITTKEDPVEIMHRIVISIQHYVGFRSCTSIADEYLEINCTVDLDEYDHQVIQSIAGNLMDLIFIEGNLEEINCEDNMIFIKL